MMIFCDPIDEKMEPHYHFPDISLDIHERDAIHRKKGNT